MLRLPVTTRFAPSPSGPLHVGHLLAACEARRLATLHGGRCLLRIEDIDTARTRNPEWVRLMLQDLVWLGLAFDGEVMVQSRRFGVYAAVLEQLRQRGLLYPCFCTRAEIRARQEEISRAPHGCPAARYPGTCRALPPELVQEKLAAGVPHAWRVNMRRVEDSIGCPLWEDLRRGVQRCVPSACDDAVLARKDAPVAYHLAVVVDDAAQGVSLVTRGEDLFEATHIHRALQGALGLPVPQYCHHRLLCDASGKRLAKRDGARSIASLRAAGWSPQRLLDSLQAALRRGGRWEE
ncbi:MAG: tRNA glutamyl-Q(34) synthetase GluQRS [Akkermansiaceae bacterium]|nr:tRNA glutamyl-Q(34) synthetase GluQRS [Akkermansiaceae bacterium]